MTGGVHPPQCCPPSAVLSTLRSAATEDGLRRTGYGGRATEDGQHVPTLTYAAWPSYDPALLVEDILEIPVQVNGKLRDVIKVPANATNAELEAAALASDKVKPFLAGKTIRKVIVLPKKLVNIVVG